MKKKFNFKLTACLVSLFIGFALLIFFYDKKPILSISLVLIAVSLFFFAKIRAGKIDNILKLTEQEIDEELNLTNPDNELIGEVYSEMGKLKKQKKSMNFTFNTCALLLIVLAIFALF